MDVQSLTAKHGTGRALEQRLVRDLASSEYDAKRAANLHKKTRLAATQCTMQQFAFSLVDVALESILSCSVTDVTQSQAKVAVGLTTYRHRCSLDVWTRFEFLVSFFSFLSVL
jgi:hypothetical protein